MKWNIERKYLRVGLIALGVIILSLVFNYTLHNSKEMANIKAVVKGTMAPIVMGCILAYLLTPVLNFFEDYCFLPLARVLFKKKEQSRKSFARGMSILCTMFLLFIIIIGSFYLVIPQVYQSLVKIVTDAPTYYDEIQKWVDSLNPEKSEISRYLLLALDRVYSQAINYLNNSILPNMDKIVAGITSGIVGGLKIILNVVLAVIISIYVMAGKENLISVSKKLIYSVFRLDHANRILDGMRYAGSVFGGFVNGKIIDSFIIGGICYVFMSFAGFEYSVLISIIVGVTNIIPYFGPFIGGIPSVLIIFMISPKQGLIFAVFVLILQQVDGNIIGPLVLGDRLRLSSMWILFSILIGGGLFGILGMILGAPCFACLYTLISTISKSKLQKNNLPTETEVYYDIMKIVQEDEKCVLIPNENRRIKEAKEKKEHNDSQEKKTK